MATANATVMFTDIRGFTARTSKGTREGLEELLETHEELLLPVIKHYDGRVVKTIGDAFLVVFESPTNAVLCGVLIQRRLREFNGAAPEEKRIEIRIAINSGEVTLRGDDVFGEPVNIAARIEGITEPNEIYFTEATYLTMQKAEVPSSEVGLRRLKGIPEEIKVYRVIQDEDNALYRAIVQEARVADDASAVGTLSVPQWPPPKGRLQGPRSSLWVPLLVVVLLVSGFFVVSEYRAYHRYDDARAALEAEDWETAQRLAGAIWADRGDDQEAIRILTEAIRGEMTQIAQKHKDPSLLQEVWQQRKLEWGNLPAQAELDRHVTLSTLQLRRASGDLVGALEGYHQLYERDRNDTEVQKAIVVLARPILMRAQEGHGFRDRKDVDTWLERFRELSERYGNLPGFKAVRADAASYIGGLLLGSDNNFWKDAGIELLRTFLRENPDDRDGCFDARVLLVAYRRWSSDPRQLFPYLEEDPERGKDMLFRNALVAHLLHDYDLEGEEEQATREMFATYWADQEVDMLHQWMEGDNLKAALNAYLLLREGGHLRDGEADKVMLDVMLHKPSGFDKEMEAALSHWAAYLARSPEDARKRARHLVPGETLGVAALRRGAADARWREVVGALFFPRMKAHLLEVVTQTGYSTERYAALLLLQSHDALDPVRAYTAHVTSLKQYLDESPRDIWPVLVAALEYFATAHSSVIRDPSGVRSELAELSDRVDEKIEALGRHAKAWRDLQTRVQKALANIDP